MALRSYANARQEVETKKGEDLDDTNPWIAKAKEVEIFKVKEAMAERMARLG
jgi:hypothetical protein